MGRLHPIRHHFLDVQLANGLPYSSSSYTNPSSTADGTLRKFSSVPPLNLSGSRGENTRVQLQRQRLREQQHAIVVSQKLPGLKTSAGTLEPPISDAHVLSQKTNESMF
jgi:hypothetical protein